MKLSECKIGKIVILKNLSGNRQNEYAMIGYIVGLTLNISIQNSGTLSHSEIRDGTIPLVKFPNEECPRGVHFENLEEYEDRKYN